MAAKQIWCKFLGSKFASELFKALFACLDDGHDDGDYDNYNDDDDYDYDDDDCDDDDDNLAAISLCMKWFSSR